MKQIRRGVFETNSSSTHSITICSQEAYNEWKDGKLLFGDWNRDFIKAEELTPYDYECAKAKYESSKGKYYKNWEELSAEDQKDYTTEYVLMNKKKKSYDEYLTYKEWYDRHNCGTETFSECYTTDSGDKIIAFGYYGYDG